MSVAVSVVVPAYRAERTLERCVAALLQQDLSASYEVIVVASADRDSALPTLANDPRVRLFTHVPRLPAATARNFGVAQARGSLIAFTDADVVAPPSWLRTLMLCAGDGDRCIAGSVDNGTPRSIAGTTEYLIQFLDLHPARPAATAWHGATCNLLISRMLWDRHGPFPEDLDGGEDTLLTTALRERDQFEFAPTATVTHLNRTGLAAVLAHQFEFGRFTARLARRAAHYKLRPLVRYWPLAPVATVVRIVSLYARALAWLPPAKRVQTVLLFPVVVVALTAWGTGLLLEGLRLSTGG